MLSRVALGTKCRSLAMMPTTLLSFEAMCGQCDVSMTNDYQLLPQGTLHNLYILKRG